MKGDFFTVLYMVLIYFQVKQKKSNNLYEPHMNNKLRCIQALKEFSNGNIVHK